MKNPLRFWRTGAVAVVLAAIGGASFADDADAMVEGSVLCITSPYDVDETVQRIELSARQRGVAVFGCFAQGGHGAGVARSEAGAGEVRVVVLESAQGGTPVWMTADEAHASEGRVFELPLGIRVRPGGDGRAEVWIEARNARNEMPQGLERDLAARDEVVRAALRT
ncbi:MAG TPA: hypothetical protein PKC97_16855 [Burkholderiaceae bacterium]|nr:hypothetical protein [Burkholderiaceae bacterium]